MRQRIVQECTRLGLAGLWWPRGGGGTCAALGATSRTSLAAPWVRGGNRLGSSRMPAAQPAQVCGAPCAFPASAASAMRALHASSAANGAPGAPPAVAAAAACAAADSNACSAPAADRDTDVAAAADASAAAARSAGASDMFTHSTATSAAGGAGASGAGNEAEGGGTGRGARGDSRPQTLSLLAGHYGYGSRGRGGAGGPPPPPAERVVAALVADARPEALAQLSPPMLVELVERTAALLKHGGHAYAPHVHALHGAVVALLATNAARSGGLRPSGLSGSTLPRLALGLAHGGARPGPEFMAPLATAAAMHSSFMAQGQVASMFRGLAVLDPHCRALPADDGWLEVLGARAAELLPCMRGEELAHVLRALGMWARLPAALDAAALVRALGEAAASTSPSSLSRALWAASVLRIPARAPDVAAIAAALSASAPRSAHGVNDVASALRHVSKLWRSNAGQFSRQQVNALDALAHGVMERAGKLPARQVVHVMHSFEALRYVPPPAVADALVSRWKAVLPEAPAYDAASMLRSAGALGVAVPRAQVLDTLRHVAQLCALHTGTGASAAGAGAGGGAGGAGERGGAAGDEGSDAAAAAAPASALQPDAPLAPSSSNVLAAAALALYAGAMLGAYEPGLAGALVAAAEACADELQPIGAQQLLQAHEAYRLLAPPGDRVEALLPPALLAACRGVVASNLGEGTLPGSFGASVVAAARTVQGLREVHVNHVVCGGLFRVHVVGRMHAGRRHPHTAGAGAGGGAGATAVPDAGAVTDGAPQPCVQPDADGGTAAGADGGGAAAGADGGGTPAGADGDGTAAGTDGGAAAGADGGGVRRGDGEWIALVIDGQSPNTYARNNVTHSMGQSRFREALLRAAGFVVVLVPSHVWTHMSRKSNSQHRYLSRLVSRELEDQSRG